MSMHIRPDDLRSPEVRALLEEHLRDMHEISPPESVHALDLDDLRHPSVTLWTAWAGTDLLGCGALKQLDPAHGEIKSMRTAAAHRGKGVARAMLQHLLAEARARSCARVSLETGSEPAFLPARRLYESAGFTYCSPYASYVEDPNSVFMTLAIMEPQYRAATQDDLPGICALADELNAIHHESWPHVFAQAAASDRDRAHWEKSIGRDDAETFLAFEGGDLVAFITAFLCTQSGTLLQPLCFVTIGSVCVRRDVRGKGLGTALMKRVEAWAAGMDATEVRLQVWAFNAPAISLYEELGYAVRSLSMAKLLPGERD